ncbi:MAG TPA: hypothetical protein VFR25_06795 [Candidatus Eisenbacteria bacterium]|nr:hypothetical protein [Candidatus Eisenbacteria bacterium]
MDDQVTLPRPASRPSLPPVSTYLRTVLALGKASIKPGFPALIFLYFYRLGMGLYVALSMDRVQSIDEASSQAVTSAALVQIPAYIPVLVLIYMPFLLLQDGILRGVATTLGSSVRSVLERMLAFLVCAVAQLVIVAGPPFLLFAGAAILVRTIPTRPEELTRAIGLLAMVPCLIYAILMLFMLWFAFPALVLDRRGPFRSIRVSFSLVASHFGGILGRLIVVLFFVVLAALVLSFPAEILQVVTAVAGGDHPLLKVATVVWTSAVSAFLFPFVMASLVVLYRALVPAASGSAVPAGAAVAVPEAHRVSSPFQFE